MDLDLLRTLLVLADEGNMTRAATRLHLTQPAVSAQLRRLEDALGQPLFERSRRGLALTESGELFLSYARRALETVAQGKQALMELEGLSRGALSIGGGATATTCLLPPLLAQFHRDYPGIDLYVREQGSAQTLASVRDGELELGIITLPVGGSLKRADQAELEAIPWLTDELRLIVPPGHPWSGQGHFEWSALAGQPLVLFEGRTAVRALLDARLKAAGVTPHIVMELRSIESIKQMVTQGIGAGFVSSHALPTPDAMHGLTGDGPPLGRQLAVVRRLGRRLSRAAQTFYERMMATAR